MSSFPRRLAAIALSALAMSPVPSPVASETQPGPSRRKSDAVAFAILHRWELSTPFWLWPVGYVVEGCFKGGSIGQRRVVVEAGREWMRHGNLRFDFGAGPGFRGCPQLAPYPPLRIEIADGESNAKVGTTAFDLIELEPTVRLSPTNRVTGEIVSETAFRAIALHELGHALGLRHEHQHPDSKCVENFSWPVLCARVEQLRSGTPTAVAIYAAMNFIPRIAQPGVEKPRYDPVSIMHYRFTPPFVHSMRGACAGAPARTLSDGDKARIARLYPRSREEQQRLILAHADRLTQAIAATDGLRPADADRLMAEARRIASLGHPDLDLPLARRDEAAGRERTPGAPAATIESLALGNAAELADSCRASSAGTSTPSRKR